MLLPRFLTGLVGVPLLILSIWWGSIPYLILIYGITLLALYEYYSLLNSASIPVNKLGGMALGTILFISIIFVGSSVVGIENSSFKTQFLPFVLALILVLFSLLSFFNRSKESGFLALALMWFGNFFIVWSLAHLYLLRELRPDGLTHTFFLFFVVWSLDVGAYLGGVKCGRRRMSEYISPKKSWEGSFVGSLCGILTAALFQVSVKLFPNIQSALIFASVIVVVAQISDLSESLLKRNVGVKDSGTLLPGHGGLLDRFDSFLLTAPLYYYCVIFFVENK